MTFEPTTLAIMQPYFLPYLGYFQLGAAAQTLVIYDNIKYTKKGWINRNRLLSNGSDSIFSLPLEKAPDSAMIFERQLAASFSKAKLLDQFRGAYAHSPSYREFFPVMQQIVEFPELNLFSYIRHSIERIFDYLEIGVSLITSSSLLVGPERKGEDRVLATCIELRAARYINLIGGRDLYNPRTFEEFGIELKFLRLVPNPYPQRSKMFVPHLSIADLLMSVPRSEARQMLLNDYELS